MMKEYAIDTLTEYGTEEFPGNQRVINPQLPANRKRLIDTIKMIAYRAETAMANIVREKLARKDDARAVVRDLCRTEVDIAPDPGNDILQIRIHSLANPRNNIAVEHLLNHLNQTEFNYPGTTLRMIFSLNATTPPNPKR